MYYTTARKKLVKWVDLYKIDKLLVEYLYDYCADNNFELCIFGEVSKDQEMEKLFYNQIIKNSNWKFIANNEERNVYSLVDSYKCIVGVDSTLLYEAFARGNKVVFFSARGQFIGEDVGFFWMARRIFSKEVYFGPPLFQKILFMKRLEILLPPQRGEWKELYNKYKSCIMEYDSGNNKIYTVLKKYWSPNGGKLCLTTKSCQLLVVQVPSVSNLQKQSTNDTSLKN